MRLPHLLLGLLAGLLASGVLLLLLSDPRGYPVVLGPLPSPEPVRVHVAGAVLHPGVYLLPAGARVEAAIQSAGGVVPGTSLDGLNLASPLEDGQKVYVPPAEPPPATSQAGTSPGDSPGSLLNLNRATAAELEALPGIGPALAQSITDYRQENGPFARIEDLLLVPGIGPAKVALIAPYVEVP